MQNTPESPIYLGFASQKGGVGKSSLAEALASILYYEKGIPLLVVDCDGTQESFYKLRQREKAAIEESPSLSEQMKSYFDQLGRKAYRVLKADPKEAIAKTNAYLSSHPNEDFKLVIFDFPGHAGTRELLELSLEMDCILSPIEADVQSIIRQSKSTRFPIKKYKNGTCFSRPVFCIPFTPRKGAFSPLLIVYFTSWKVVE